MEDEKGLDLSLAPPSGGSSFPLQGKYGSSSNVWSDESNRDSKLINEFKNFLEGRTQPPLKVEENFYNNYAKAAVGLETSKNSRAGGIWLTNDRLTEIEEGKTSSVGEKRKSLFSEIQLQKKLERESSHPDLTDKNRVSHISLNTDDGSTAENEDVADSEVDGSTSRPVSHHDGGSNRVAASASLSRHQNEIHAVGDLGGIEVVGQKRFTLSSGKEFNVMDAPMSYGVSFQAQPVNMSYFGPVKDSNPSVTAGLRHQFPGMIHAMAPTNGERPVLQPVVPANLPLVFGYSPVQLPELDKDNSRGIVSDHPQIHATYPGRNPVNSDPQNDNRKLTPANMPDLPVMPHKSTHSAQYDGRTAEHGKQHVGDEGYSARAEGDLNGNQTTLLVKEVSDKPRAESLSSDFPAIKPGIAADLKFGGCGSYPNLPWVSTTGPGPNGRTISGVTYRYSPTQVKIVCACHGSHMSPVEFVRHAGDENSTPDPGTGVASSVPSSNPAASAHS